MLRATLLFETARFLSVASRGARALDLGGGALGVSGALRFGGAHRFLRGAHRFLRDTRGLRRAVRLERPARVGFTLRLLGRAPGFRRALGVGGPLDLSGAPGLLFGDARALLRGARSLLRRSRLLGRGARVAGSVRRGAGLLADVLEKLTEDAAERLRGHRACLGRVLLGGLLSGYGRRLAAWAAQRR